MELADSNQFKLPDLPFPLGMGLNDLQKAEGVLTELANAAGMFAQFGMGALAAQFGRSKTEEERPDISSRYRILVEQIPAIVFMAFVERGISEAYVSPQIEQMLGFTQQEWLQDPVRWFQQIHPEDKVRWSTEAARTFLTGETLRSTYRVLARDGRVIWFKCEVRMVRHADGRPWFIHGVGFDISELKQVEEALKQAHDKLALHVIELRQEIAERQRAERALTDSEQTLRAIFEYAPDTMVIVDGQGLITRVNGQLEQMFGYLPGEIIGQPVEILMPESARPRHVAHRHHYTLDPNLRPMGKGVELRARRKDGSDFPVEIMLSPVSRDAGSFVIAVLRDITRRKRDEEALREFATRQQELSHRLIEVQEAERRRLALELHDEFGQTLTGLKFALEMTERTVPADSRESIVQAQRLVNELMGRARKLSLDLRPATLDHLGLLSALLGLTRNYSTQTGIEIDFRHHGIGGRRFEPDVEISAYRVVQEALTNVARHAQVQQASVNVWADGLSLFVGIEDKGVGFDLEEALSAGRSSGVAGMRERVLLLGGHFNCESRPGAGTRLTAEWHLDDEATTQ